MSDIRAYHLKENFLYYNRLSYLMLFASISASDGVAIGCYVCKTTMPRRLYEAK